MKTHRHTHTNLSQKNNNTVTCKLKKISDFKKRDEMIS